MARARIADIVSHASALSGVAEADIMGRSRLARIVRVRNAVYVVARANGHSFPLIGKTLDKDHSTVVHGVSRARDFAERDAEFAQLVDLLAYAAQVTKPFEPLPDHLIAGIPDKLEPIKFVLKERARTQRARNDFTSDEQPDEWLTIQDNMIAGSARLAAALALARAA